MRWWHRLDVRLFASYAAVTAVAAAAALVTVRLLVPPLFDRRMGGRLPGPMGGRPGMHDALTSALDRGLVTALLVGLVAAAVAAALVTRWVLRPIARVRTATRRLAAGHYDERVAPPREPDLAGLAEDVNALARSLDDTERRRAQLVGDVAHEMRTPLTTIRGYAEAMVDGIVAPDDEVLGVVLGEVERLERLAGDLSTLSRADEDATVARAPVDVAALAGTVVARFRPRAAQAGVDLVTAGADHLTVPGDAGRLERAIGNLVANALTYTPAGGRVTVTVDGDELACRVAVDDTGIGLAPDQLDRVFERFYRVEGVERPPGGSGIGLAIARADARAHGGDVVATSPGPGRGATFTLRVPRPG